MAFNLFGSDSKGDTTKLTNSQQTNVSDNSATAAEGAISSSGSGAVTVNSVDSRITGQAFDFGGRALDANAAVSGAALGTGLEALRLSANLVPDFLQSQGDQTAAVLKASQENANLAQQFASAGADLARSGATGGASALVQDLKPVLLGLGAIVAAVILFRKKAA